jgi:hypothetical protein
MSPEDFATLQAAGNGFHRFMPVSKKIRKVLEPIITEARAMQEQEAEQQRKDNLAKTYVAPKAKAPKESGKRRKDKALAKRLIGAKAR